MDDLTVRVVGNVAQDPEMKQTSTGKSVLEIVVVTSLPGAKQGDERQKIRVKASAWERAAESLQGKIGKGDTVVLDGLLKVESYLSRDGQPKTSLAVGAPKINVVNSRQRSEFSDADDAPF
jgi:single-strand DNA-binding protein